MLRPLSQYWRAPSDAHLFADARSHRVLPLRVRSSGVCYDRVRSLSCSSPFCPFPSCPSLNVDAPFVHAPPVSANLSMLFRPSHAYGDEVSCSKPTLSLRGHNHAHMHARMLETFESARVHANVLGEELSMLL